MRWILLALALVVMVLLLIPRELEATRTVGDQARAERMRAPTPPRADDAPRACLEGELPTDRDPCVPAGAQFAPAQ